MSEGKFKEILPISNYKIPPEIEATFGFFLTTYNIPAMLKVRLLATATPPIYHSSIISNGLIPKSILKTATQGLTPPINDFTMDAVRRVFLGGYHSANVYSNMLRLSENDPGWVKKAKNNRFGFSFLFRPTIEIFKYPLWAVVPEQVFQQNFMPDDKSIVKILSRNLFGIPKSVRIPGTFKSEVDFILLSKYFISSPQFNALTIFSSSLSSMSINPLRFIRGSIFFSAGSYFMFDSYNRFRSIEENN